MTPEQTEKEQLFFRDVFMDAWQEVTCLFHITEKSHSRDVSLFRRGFEAGLRASAASLERRLENASKS